MATRKPLVMVAGRIERLQSGDTIDANVAEVDLVEMTNDNASTISICQAVYVSGVDAIDIARANALATMDVIGLVKDASILSAATGMIQTDGVLSATTGQWDAVAGTTGGLTAGTVYYLSSSIPGFIVAAAPTAVGEFVVQLGRAISTTELEITIVDPIQL